MLEVILKRGEQLPKEPIFLQVKAIPSLILSTPLPFNLDCIIELVMNEIY
jgi:hypothetical protein